MFVTLIGTGNLGTNLHAALVKAGHDVQWLHGRGLKAEEVAGDVIIMAVKDDAIPSVAEALTQYFYQPHPDKATGEPIEKKCPLLVHTAGSVPLCALPSKRRGVFYPMQTFSKHYLVDFSEIPVFIEAENEADAELLQQLSSSVSRKVYPLDSQQRKSLHLAAVFACNFVNHCYSMSARCLSDIGLPFDIMLPLIDETARKVHTLSPKEAQTGPAVRYDTTIIHSQEQMLTGLQQQIYTLMSQSIHETS